MSARFVVIYEAPADFAIASELADRVLIEQIDWLDESLLDSQRQWVGDEPIGSPLLWKSIPSRARASGIRVHGHFDGEPGEADARAARRAIAYVLRNLTDVSAIVLVRDADDQVERRKGLEQARSAFVTECRIVIGFSICERESWVISGFEVGANEEEAIRLELECEKLGHNPCLHPEDLTAGKDDTALRSPKRVLSALTNGDGHRQRECWVGTSLNVLRTRGQHNGLAAYMEEVQSKLVPLISGYESSS